MIFFHKYIIASSAIITLTLIVLFFTSKEHHTAIFLSGMGGQIVLILFSLIYYDQRIKNVK